MKITTLSWIIVVALFAGCASQPIVLSPVGPEPAGHAAHVATGQLQVFSATETHPDGDNTYYYPHTGYSILSDSGQMVTYVNNHIGTMDETPSVVTVPVGNYRIVAQSEGYGRVTVPVVIAGGRTTKIHLERNWKPSANLSNDVVRLPGGEAVGWNASSNP